MESFVKVLLLTFILNGYFFIDCYSSQSTCEQYENAVIPVGTDAEIIQYAIDGNHCIINKALDTIGRVHFQGMLDAVKQVYYNAERLNYCDERITGQIHQITNSEMSNIYKVATDSFAKQIHLNDAAWLKIAERKTVESSEKDILSVMKRVHRVTKKNLYIATLITATVLPKIIEVNEEAACKIKSILCHCNPSGRTYTDIAKIKQEAANESVKLFSDGRAKVIERHAKILAALQHGLQYIQENNN